MSTSKLIIITIGFSVFSFILGWVFCRDYSNEKISTMTNEIILYGDSLRLLENVVKNQKEELIYIRAKEYYDQARKEQLGE